MSKFRELVLKETEEYFAINPYYEYQREMTNGDVLYKLCDIQEQLSQLHYKGEGDDQLITLVIRMLESKIKNKILSAHDIADERTRGWLDVFTNPDIIGALYEEEK